MLTKLGGNGADKTGPIENGVAKAGSELGCNPFLCRGYQYEDNEAVEYQPGQVIDFHVDLVAGHHPGYAVSRICQPCSLSHSMATWPLRLLMLSQATSFFCYIIVVLTKVFLEPLKNVSIVDLETNTIIGNPLRSWDDYPNASETPRTDRKRKTKGERLRFQESSLTTSFRFRITS